MVPPPLSSFRNLCEVSHFSPFSSRSPVWHAQERPQWCVRGVVATPKSPPFSGLDAASLDPSLSLSTPPIPSSVCIFLPFLCSPSFLALLLSPQSPLEGRTHCSTMATIAHSTSPLLNAVTPLLECGAQQEADHQMHFPQHQQQQQSRHERASRDPPQSHLHISSLKRGHRESEELKKGMSLRAAR